jgi:hypothetical protein
VARQRGRASAGPGPVAGRLNDARALARGQRRPYGT